LAALNDLWQGNPIRRTRAGEGALTLFGRRLAVHLMVQPGVTRTLMADPMAGDTGFLPRCLLCEPTSAIGTRIPVSFAAHAMSGSNQIDSDPRRLSALLYEGQYRVL
jgi:hypothetical protein